MTFFYYVFIMRLVAMDDYILRRGILLQILGGRTNDMENKLVIKLLRKMNNFVYSMPFLPLTAKKKYVNGRRRGICFSYRDILKIYTIGNDKSLLACCNMREGGKLMGYTDNTCNKSVEKMIYSIVQPVVSFFWERVIVIFFSLKIAIPIYFQDGFFPPQQKSDKS